ncbi:hypothetical protein F5146DRAFT_1123893 [Armillaria mellea]|nr:hypothetical protein F5146DRAFT_1123893 [Armillaria mellea]
MSLLPVFDRSIQSDSHQLNIGATWIQPALPFAAENYTPQAMGITEIVVTVAVALICNICSTVYNKQISRLLSLYMILFSGAFSFVTISQLGSYTYQLYQASVSSGVKSLETNWKRQSVKEKIPRYSDDSRTISTPHKRLILHHVQGYQQDDSPGNSGTSRLVVLQRQSLTVNIIQKRNSLRQGCLLVLAASVGR